MFPDELKHYQQWVCWRKTVTADGRPTKLPYTVRGKLASVADPRTWSDYDTAVYTAMNSGDFYNGIGFVLTEDDPYCFIDLDDPADDTALSERHQRIAAAMDSYSEVSPSGRGLHIITRARVNGGRRRGKVEVYSSQRYMTMTGATYQDKPIADRDYLVNQLWAELDSNGGGNNITLKVENQPQRHEDELIYTIACQAENGAKFEALWRGEWQQFYQSQSEADFAMINMLGFYSRNIEQIHRMFHFSALGKRLKAQRKTYIDSMIKRSFDNLPPAIPLQELITKTANDLAKIDAAKDKAEGSNPFAGPLFANVPDPAYDWTAPPGLLGEIAQFVYSAAPRPVKEIALGAAIGLMAGICGRAYNVSATGLNQYVLVLAKTGVGKEAISSCIGKLLDHVKKIVPAAMEFLGPAEIASGQALIKYLAKHPCFVSIVGEFGITLQQMCLASANPSQVTLRKTLLSLYNKSGEADSQREIIYSDKEKNTQVIKSPAFSLLGESTPETFYPSLDESMIAQGLFPRFTCIEYLGDRPPLNKNHASAEPTPELIEKLGQLTANCLMLAQHQRTVHVMLDEEAQKFSSSFDRKCDAKINTSEAEVARQLWNRAHVKTLKLAALIAIGQNAYQPMITMECIKWAELLVERDVKNVLKKFETGKAGRDTGELNQINDLVYAIAEYCNRPYLGLEKYSVNPQMHADKVIEWSYLLRKLMLKACYKGDRLGATVAIKRSMEALKADGAVRELNAVETHQRYGRTCRCFVISDISRFAR